MGHVTSAQCADAVLGTLAAGERTALERHVRQCSACGETLRFWQRFTDLVSQDRAYEPPSAVVSVVNRYIADHQPDRTNLMSRTADRVRALVATLTFDTLQHALPVGVRASTSGTRQLLYDVSPFSLDLRLESSGRSQRILLAGQIANADDPDNGGRDARVAVISTNREVTAVLANEFGEFHCEFDRRDDLILSIALKDGGNVVIPLDRFPVSGYRDESADHSSETTA